MKRLFVALIIIGLVFSIALPLHADGPGKKLTRGALNLVSSPLELPNAIWDYWQMDNAKDFVAGLFWGPLAGIFNFTKRAVVGVYEIVTFPLPVPAEYKPIIDDPAFFQKRGGSAE